MHTYLYIHTTCYTVHISMYIQWGLRRIPAHQSGPVHGVWWAGGLVPGSKWIPVRNPNFKCIGHHICWALFLMIVWKTFICGYQIWTGQKHNWCAAHSYIGVCVLKMSYINTFFEDCEKRNKFVLMPKRMPCFWDGCSNADNTLTV